MFCICIAGKWVVDRMDRAIATETEAESSLKELMTEVNGRHTV